MTSKSSDQTQAVSRSDKAVDDKTKPAMSLLDQQHEDLERLEVYTSVFYMPAKGGGGGTDYTRRTG